jgi:hypothetical protein
MAVLPSEKTAQLKAAHTKNLRRKHIFNNSFSQQYLTKKRIISIFLATIKIFVVFKFIFRIKILQNVFCINSNCDKNYTERDSKIGISAAPKPDF